MDKCNWRYNFRFRRNRTYSIFFVIAEIAQKEKKRESLGAILNQLSLFGRSLHVAYNDWCDNINKLGPILDEHIEYIEKYNEEVKSTHQEGYKIIEKSRACACELAPYLSS